MTQIDRSVASFDVIRDLSIGNLFFLVFSLRSLLEFKLPSSSTRELQDESVSFFFSLVSGSVLNGGDSAPSPDWTPSMWADMVDGYQRAALSSRLGIPMIYGTDAVHGHNNVFGSTVFPHNIGLGATRYKELEFVPFLVGCVWMFSKLHFWNHQSRDLKLRQILI